MCGSRATAVPLRKEIGLYAAFFPKHTDPYPAVTLQLFIAQCFVYLRRFRHPPIGVRRVGILFYSWSAVPSFLEVCRPIRWFLPLLPVDLSDPPPYPPVHLIHPLLGNAALKIVAPPSQLQSQLLLSLLQAFWAFSVQKVFQNVSDLDELLQVYGREPPLTRILLLPANLHSICESKTEELYVL